MAERVIDHYIDRNGVRGDTEFMLNSLNEVRVAFEKIQGVKVDLSALKGMTGFAQAAQQGKAGLDSLSVATDTVTKRIAQMNGQSKEFTNVLLAQTKAQKVSAETSLVEAKARTENAKAAEIERKSVEAAAKTKANEQKQIEQATNDYLQLSKAYNEAALKAKNYILVLGENHPLAIEAVKDANDLGNILKKLDAAVGQNQPNVGNYKSAFNGLGFSFTQVARELPSLAINFQTFALAISNNLPMVADEIAKAKNEIAALKAEGKDTPSLFSKISKAILSPQVGLSLLITGFTLLSGKIFGASKEVKNFDDVIEGANERIKKAEESIKGLNEQVDFLKKIGSITVDINFGDDFERNILKARQNSVLIDEQIQGLEDQLPAFKKAFDDTYSYAAEKISNAGRKIIDGRELFHLPSTLVQDLSKQDQQYVKGVTDSFEKLQKAENDLNKLREDQSLARAGIRQVLADKERADNEKAIEDAKNRAKKEKDLADQRLKALFEIKALQLQRTIDFNKEIADDESKSEIERLSALRRSKDAADELILLRADTEIKIGEKTSEEVQLIEEKKLDELLRLYRKFNSDRRKIQNDEAKEREADEKKIADALEKGIKERFENFSKDEEARRKKQEETANKLHDKKIELIKDEVQQYKELYSEIEGLITDLFTAQQDREISRLQDQIDQLEKVKQKDIEVVNQTVTNREDAAAQIAIINARAQAQEEQLQKKQRDAEKKKAEIEKLGKAADIIGNTASGVVSLSIKAAEAKAQAALLASNPLTASYAPVALANAGLIAAEIPVAIAIGAAQLARVLIPRFFRGKNVGDAYEGPAWVDDGGRPEAIIRESGDVEIGTSKPRITYLKKRDIVLPDARMLVDAVVNGHMGGRLLVAPVQSNSEGIEQAISRMEKKVVNAIQNKKELHLSASEGGMAALWKHGAGQTKYIDENTNW